MGVTVGKVCLREERWKNLMGRWGKGGVGVGCGVDTIGVARRAGYGAGGFCDVGGGGVVSSMLCLGESATLHYWGLWGGE